jgi:hypothetical protein
MLSSTTPASLHRASWENGSLADHDRQSDCRSDGLPTCCDNTQSLSCLIITCDTLGVIIAANRLGYPHVAITEGCICDPLSCKAVNCCAAYLGNPMRH